MKGDHDMGGFDDCFNHTLIFADPDLVVHSALQHVHDVILEIIPVAFPVESHEIPLM